MLFCQKRAKSKEVYTLRAKNTVVSNTSHLSAQESTVKNPHEETVLCRISAEKPLQELMMEELGEITSSNEM